MKRILMIGFILITLTTFIVINEIYRNKEINNIITVAEVTHSVFYAPFYVALEKNFFNDLEIELTLTSGANNVVAAVISGDADIGFCGPEATIYSYINNNVNTIKSFASLTKRDGQFLVLRNNIKYDTFNDIDGLTILAGRTGGMPLLNFKNALKNTNTNNVNIDTTIDFANLTSAFIAGTGDGVNLFEPNATILVNAGYGYIADNIGTYSGTLPYTTFNATTSFIESNKEIINKFYNGINEGLKYVQEHTPVEIAEIIKPQFPDTKKEELITMITNYKNADSWYLTPQIPEEDFNNLQDLMIDNNELKVYVPYKDLVHEINNN